jgi:hypothetical protein
VKTQLLALAAVAALAACGGGGSSSPVTPSTTPPTQTPQSVSLKLEWTTAVDAGFSVSSLTRRASVVRSAASAVTFANGSTVVVGSPNGGTTVYDDPNPAYLVAVVSTSAPVTFTTTSNEVTIQPTPTASPNPSASPAVLLVPATPNASQTGQTVTASAGSASATDNVLIVPMLALVVMNNGTPVSPDASAFTFNASCQPVPQAMNAGADVYITGPANGTLYFPNGGTLLQNGFNVSTLTASQYANNGTSTTFANISGNFYDTLIFETGNGHVAFLYFTDYGGANVGSGAAYIEAEYGCLN